MIFYSTYVVVCSVCGARTALGFYLALGHHDQRKFSGQWLFLVCLFLFFKRWIQQNFWNHKKYRGQRQKLEFFIVKMDVLSEFLHFSMILHDFTGQSLLGQLSSNFSNKGLNNRWVKTVCSHANQEPVQHKKCIFKDIYLEYWKNILTNKLVVGK